MTYKNTVEKIIETNTAEEIIETLLNTMESLAQTTIEERRAFQNKVAAAIMKEPNPSDPDEIDKLCLFFDLLNERIPAPKR